MEKYIQLAEELINFPKGDDPEAPIRLFAAAKLSCAPNYNFNSIPLRIHDICNTKYQNKEKKSYNLDLINPDEFKAQANSDSYSQHKEKLKKTIQKPIRCSDSNLTELASTEPTEILTQKNIIKQPMLFTSYMTLNKEILLDSFILAQSNLREAISSQKAKLVETLHEASITKTINNRVINEAMLAAHRSECISLDTSKKKPILNFTLSNAKFHSLEDELEVKLYLHPIFNGYAHKLFNKRICEDCGRVFFYTLEKAKFCSERCQGMARRKRKSNQ